MKPFMSSGLALVAAAVLAVAPAAPPAFAASTIDPAATVTLNIYKYEGDPTSNVDASGAPIGATPLPGVTFTIQRLDNVDLTSAAGWTALSGVTAAQLADGDPGNDNGITLGTGTELVTDGAGLATATNPTVSVGAYLVTEQQFGSYTVAPPFLVTLPHEAADGTWDYVQNVYPKNQNVQPTKSVDHTGATIGSTLAYTVNAPVPAGELTAFAVSDPLASGVLTAPAPGEVVVTAGSVALDGADYAVTVTGSTVNVDFTDAGRAKLQAARAGDPALEVSVAFPATVAAIPANGVIENTATVTGPNGMSNTTDIDVSGTLTPASTTFAPLTVTKTGGDGIANSELNGAVFELYTCETDPAGGYRTTGAPIQMATTAAGDQAATITTGGGVDGGASATATALGVPVTSFSTDETGAVSSSYCVVETKSPDGLVRNPEPQPVTYTPGQNGEAGTLTASVLNERDTILGQLPATGAWGLGLILLVGVALIARGIFGGRREEQAEASA